mgnify:FL=1
MPDEPEVPDEAAFSLYPTTPLEFITKVVFSDACSANPSSFNTLVVPTTCSLASGLVSFIPTLPVAYISTARKLVLLKYIKSVRPS